MANKIGWGQGSVNNDIGWGQGASNNDIGWGNIQAISPSGETNIVGGGGAPQLFPNWEDNNVDGSVFMTALNNYVPQTFNNTINTFGSFSGVRKWAGGVLAPNGKIYGIPYSATQV